MGLPGTFLLVLACLAAAAAEEDLADIFIPVASSFYSFQQPKPKPQQPQPQPYKPQPQPQPSKPQPPHPAPSDPALQCYQSPPCDRNALYRTYDGSCNNLRFPTWGMAGTHFLRLLPARYADGQGQPPQSVVGGPLPPPRELRRSLFSSREVPDELRTLMVMSWGQFIAHDAALSGDLSTKKDLVAECCDGLKYSETKAQKPECIPIRVDEQDPFYSRFYRTCLPVIRSNSTAELPCGYRPAEQLNSATHFVDGSMVYGSDEKRAHRLREHRGGRLKVQTVGGGTFPPNDPDPIVPCFEPEGHAEGACYMAGDGRVNQNTGIAVLQTLMLREHNRVAGELGRLNPHWDDERLYQEARKVCWAEIQHFSWREWQSVALGEPPENVVGFADDYDNTLDPSTTNIFTTGCFRFYHSLITTKVNLVDEDYTNYRQITLSDTFRHIHDIQEENNYDRFIRGLGYQACQAADKDFTPEITNLLFKAGKEFGDDLTSVDVQRGRDHGLPSYNSLREFTGQERATKFSDFANLIPKEDVDKLAGIYKHVDDVDLLVGISLETLLNNSVVGPSCRHVIKDQFDRWRHGDRFFYNLQEAPGAFTLPQLQEIRKITLSSVMCLNSNLKEMQRNVFFKVSDSNPLEPCSDVVEWNLEKWREEK